MSPTEFTFRYTSKYDNQPERIVEIKTNSLTLDEILKDFEFFLKGCGFAFDGEIDICKD